MSARENLTLGRADATDDEIARGARGRPGRLRPRPAVGARHPDRRAGHVAVRRPAAAARAGPRRARPAAGPGARRHRCPRSTCTPRRWSRRRCAGCSPTTTGARRRPPRLDGAAGRPGRAAPGRHDHPRRRRTASCWPPCPAYRDLLAADDERAERRRRRDERRARDADRRPQQPARRASQDWRGVAAEARRRRSPSETAALLAGALAPAARRPAAPVPAARSGCWSSSCCRERRPAVDPAPRQGGHRHAASRRSGDGDDLAPLLVIVGVVLVADARSRRSPGSSFLRAVRADRPGRPARAAAAGVPPLPAAQPGVPRRATPPAG